MKTKLFGILIAWAVTASAGTLTDSANVFGPQSVEVNKALADLPVWFETRVATPEQGLKDYTDEKAKVLTTKGFLVVITTQPRAWRISMNPVGLASSEATRIAGDAMTAKFKQGKFDEGAIGLANRLNELAAPKKADSEEWSFWTWFSILFGAFVLVIVVFVWIFTAAENGKRQRERANREPSALNPDDLSHAQKRQAEKLFNQYTPEQRRAMSAQYVNSPEYYHGVTDSPFFWWWLMSTNNDPCCHDYSNPVAAATPYSSPAPFYSPSEPSRSYEAPARSSSDDSGSSYSSGSSSDSGGGSSSDSGSSSGDCGSSSDAGGSGGGW